MPIYQQALAALSLNILLYYSAGFIIKYFIVLFSGLRPHPERTIHVAFEGFCPDDWAVVLELRRHISFLQYVTKLLLEIGKQKQKCRLF